MPGPSGLSPGSAAGTASGAGSAEGELPAAQEPASTRRFPQLGLCRRLRTTPRAARRSDLGAPPPIPPSLREPPACAGRGSAAAPGGSHPAPLPSACRAARRGAPSPEPRRRAGPLPELSRWAGSSRFTHRGAGGRSGASPAAGDAGSAQHPAPGGGHGAAAASPPGALRWRRRAAPRPAPSGRHGPAWPPAPRGLLTALPGREETPQGVPAGPRCQPAVVTSGTEGNIASAWLGRAGVPRRAAAARLAGVGVWGDLIFLFTLNGVPSVCQ